MVRLRVLLALHRRNHSLLQWNRQLVLQVLHLRDRLRVHHKALRESHWLALQAHLRQLPENLLSKCSRVGHHRG